METRIDAWGRTVTLTIEGDKEVYTTIGLTVKGPIGTGWDRALYTIEAHAPADAVTP